MLDHGAALLEEMVVLRKAKGISQAELAARSGMTQPAIARLEKGKAVPTIETFCQLAEALGAKVTLTEMAK